MTAGVPFSNPTTSREAADQIRQDVGKLESMVWLAIRNMEPGSGGATCDEVCALMGRGGNTVRPRIRNLVLAGRVEDSGATRKSVTGRAAIVWRTCSREPQPPRQLAGTIARQAAARERERAAREVERARDRVKELLRGMTIASLGDVQLRDRIERELEALLFAIKGVS